jgi:hypothetical protein
MILASAAYIFVRIPYFEKEYTLAIVRDTNRLSALYAEHEKKLKKTVLSESELSDFLKTAHSSFKNIALLAVSDKNMGARVSSKSGRFIRSNKIFDAILQDYMKGDIIITRDSPYIVRYYDAFTAGKYSQIKFYIFLTRIGAYRLLVAYPYDLMEIYRDIVIREALSIALLIIFISLILLLLFSRLRKKHEPVQSPYEARYGAGDISISNQPFKKNSPSIKVENAASETVRKALQEVQFSLRHSCSPESISVYLLKNGNKLSKAFEIRGASIVTIDSSSFDSFDAAGDIGAELKNSSIIMLDEAKKLVVPLLYEAALIGVCTINRNKPFTGSEISEIKQRIIAIAKPAYDFLMFERIMRDPETGLESKTHLNLKCRELLSARGEYGLICINLFPGCSGLGQDEINEVFRSVHSGIYESTGQISHVFRYDNYLLLPIGGASEQMLSDLSKKIRSALGRFRISINNETIPINPSIVSDINKSASDENFIESLIKKTIMI